MRLDAGRPSTCKSLVFKRSEMGGLWEFLWGAGGRLSERKQLLEESWENRIQPAACMYLQASRVLGLSAVIFP